mmetsp:Transcript_65272/g.194599  ORF Transcript_65272/g.194599 Transcript_65272/m.194599 type:complete len:308 (-) Transcript_65272:77-1000(-)
MSLSTSHFGSTVWPIKTDSAYDWPWQRRGRQEKTPLPSTHFRKLHSLPYTSTPQWKTPTRKRLRTEFRVRELPDSPRSYTCSITGTDTGGRMQDAVLTELESRSAIVRGKAACSPGTCSPARGPDQLLGEPGLLTIDTERPGSPLTGTPILVVSVNGSRCTGRANLAAPLAARPGEPSPASRCGLHASPGDPTEPPSAKKSTVLPRPFSGGILISPTESVGGAAAPPSPLQSSSAQSSESSVFSVDNASARSLGVAAPKQLEPEAQTGRRQQNSRGERPEASSSGAAGSSLSGALRLPPPEAVVDRE